MTLGTGSVAPFGLQQPLPPKFTPVITQREFANYHAMMVLAEGVAHALKALESVKPGSLVHVDEARRFLELAQAMSDQAVEAVGSRA